MNNEKKTMTNAVDALTQAVWVNAREHADRREAFHDFEKALGDAFQKYITETHQY